MIYLSTPIATVVYMEPGIVSMLYTIIYQQIIPVMEMWLMVTRKGMHTVTREKEFMVGSKRGKAKIIKDVMMYIRW